MSRTTTLRVPAVAVVTGASSGLGRAFALELGRMGTSVTLVARRNAELRETARLVEAEGAAAEVIVGDVIEPGLAERAIAQTEARFGRLDLVVNNAGVMFIGSVEQADPAAWWQSMKINVLGSMLWARAAIPTMRARRSGRIINVSSPGAFTQHPHVSAYCAAKAAINQLTSCLAAEVANDGITVLSFGPEALTDMARQLFEDPAMPTESRGAYREFFTAEPDTKLQHSTELFCFVAQGGADALTGHYVGRQLEGFDTADTIIERVQHVPIE
jgi:NAD(P)-dependent dehydrogenase (short-subunit alcohol dehydrogenase family)